MLDLQDTIQEIKAVSRSPSFTMQLNNLLESYPFVSREQTQAQLILLVNNTIGDKLEEELDLWERKIVKIVVDNLDNKIKYFFVN